MEKTKIDWAESSWNPVSGCLHKCQYCYARSMANRFGLAFAPSIGDPGFDGCKWDSIAGMDTMLELYSPFYKYGRMQPYPMAFYPTFHRYRLDEYKKKSGRIIFVCSMADLFGSWVPDQWIADVMAACAAAPQHQYLFLTKNPSRLFQIEMKGNLLQSPNFWYGTSTTGEPHPYLFQSRALYNAFFSIEPLLKPISHWDGAIESIRDKRIKWVIIGAETGNRKGKVIPEKPWIDDIVLECRTANIPIFMKESLRVLMGSQFVQEWPEQMLKNK